MKQESLKAADWWANAIQSKPMDNGDNSHGGMASLLGNMLAGKSRENLNAEKINSFKEKLSEKIDSLLSERGGVIISVDYHPDKILSDTASECEIDDGCFPWKTTMWIRENGVKVSCGYRAPVETIFTNQIEDAVK